MEKFKELFLEESLELLQQLEQYLMELEDNSEDKDKISGAFRCMHTIKGNAAMFGYQTISRYAHELEFVLDELREGRSAVSKQLIDLLLASSDQIKTMLITKDRISEDYDPAHQEVEISHSILQQLRILTNSDASEESKADSQQLAVRGASAGKEDKTYRILFHPAENIFLNGTNPLLLLSELKELGEYSCVINQDRIPPLSKMDPEKCYVNFEVILTTMSDVNSIHDVFIFVQDSSEIDISQVREELLSPDSADADKLGEILVERGTISERVLEDALHSRKRIGELLVEEKVITQAEVNAALAEQMHLRRVNQKRGDLIQAAHVKVRAEKLDTLVDLVGELVTAQARLNQVSSEIEAASLSAVTEHLERLIADLRDSAMSIRMLPIGNTFNKFRRLVRDLSRELGKNVDLIIEGGETELDKTVIEKLQDPLVHLIRNCLDHGIESPEERRASGKQEAGIVRLSACHSGTSVLIRVEDDGAGLDKDLILEKSISKGLAAPDSDMSEQEIFNMIFAPGFSTASEITDVSGRGVGMDVVRREIESLQGTISVESMSERGTCVTLNIPLTLAIIEGLLLHACGQYFVIPLSVVEECIEFNTLEKDKLKSRKMVNVRGRAVPYLRLEEFFSMEKSVENSKNVEQLIIINSEHMRIGLVVDGVIGNYQTVIKSLGRLYKDVDGLSGATILGDGSIALILDINGIAQAARDEAMMKEN